MEEPKTEVAAQRSGKGFIVGSAILVVLSGLVSLVRARGPGKTMAYVIGAFFGGAVVFALIGLLLYGAVRAIGKTKSASTAAKIVFWILFVLLLLNAASLLGRAVNPRAALAQAGFTADV
jgi:nitrate reductase gamma subunit